MTIFDLIQNDNLAQWVIALSTFGALILSGIALHFLRRNVLLGQDMLKESSTAAKSATESVRVTREIGVSQSRAYVQIVPHIESQELAPESTFRVRIELKNVGISPALDLSNANLLIAADSFPRELLDSAPSNGGQERFLAPGASDTNIGEIGISNEAYSLITSGATFVFVACRAWYTDVFGFRNEVDFVGRLKSAGTVEGKPVWGFAGEPPYCRANYGIGRKEA